MKVRRARRARRAQLRAGARRPAREPPTANAAYRQRRRKRHRRPAVQRHRRHRLDRDHRGGHRAFAGARPCRRSSRRCPACSLQRLYGGVNGAKTVGRSARVRRLRHRQHARPDQRPPAQRYRHGSGSISRPFRAIRSSASKSPAATAARCSTATTRSAASSTSSPRPASAVRRSRSAAKPASARSTSAWLSVSAAVNSGPWSASFYGNGIKSDGYRVNNALDQRNGVGNLNYTTPDFKAFLDGDRRRPEARLPRRPLRRPLHRAQRTRHRPQGRHHAVRLRQPAGRQRHHGLHQDAGGMVSI